ncbi:hypothetical protein NO1_1287 [Candidatus Termititenax aidoneus]|uniref:Uncharacterized protein n=1 Tax=Termititenax aidoneus TaxID=2218524 RepID=A0A388TB82_TERA1|nr:hypothetical protein NO1_1287 [Candidatus Termititenax aidoneus]
MADKLDGGLDHKDRGLTGWLKDFAKYADDDGLLKAIIWTIGGGAFFVALMLETAAYWFSARDGLCLTAYVGALGWTLKLKKEAEAAEDKQ